MDPFITIIIPTRNRSPLLTRLLESLAALRYERWEAIVVDDGSTDDTREVVERFRTRDLPLTYLWQPWSMMGAARNLALEHTRGEITAFTDDDCTVGPGWLEAIARAFAAFPEALGVQGTTVTDHARMTPFTRQVEQLEGGQPYRTCNIAYRTSILRELGGFDTQLIRGEDVVMGRRVLEHGPIVFAADAVVCHPPRPKEWADRRAWRTLLASEMHFRRTYPAYAPDRSQTLSLQKAEHVVSRWLILPLRRYWRWHYAYFRRHPLDYLRHVPLIIGEKLALFSLLPFLFKNWRRGTVEVNGLERRNVARDSVPASPRNEERVEGRHTGVPETDIVAANRGDEAPAPSRERSPALQDAVPPLISVVVPTRNRAAMLEELLTALDAQDYPRFEVIVVNDASTDDTPEILRRWQREGRIALRQEQPGGSYAARNRGWRATHGEIVAFTDDDCLPEPGWLSALARALAGRAGDGCTPGVQGVTLSTPLSADSSEATPFTHQIEQKRSGPPYRTCNIAYRRETLESAGGFDDRLRWYADNILGLRVREMGSIGFAPDAIVHHPPRPREWRDRAAWRARFAADAVHREVLYEHGSEPRVAAGTLPVILWVLRPLAKQSFAHLRYLARHPIAYARGLPPMVREKRNLLLALRDYRRERKMQPATAEALPSLPDQPLISVVVVSSRPRLLVSLLSALQLQSWEKREILVVGDGHEYAEIARWQEVRWISADEAGLGARRELGRRAAHGEIVAFTDDDCLPDPRWLEALAGAFATNPELWGVQGQTEAETGPIGAHAVRVSLPNGLFQTCNIAYRAAALERAGGLDTRFQGWFEDTALGARVLEHGPIGFEPRAVVTHRSMSREVRDRDAWRGVLRDEVLLAHAYPDFYRLTRGRSVFLAIITHWLLGSAIKTLVRELPRGLRNPRAYVVLAALLIRERIELLSALRDRSAC
jgi:glycosyltransferase involved in cell wall biosynthesis